jgi:tRNA dimethylallyltransferase
VSTSFAWPVAPLPVALVGPTATGKTAVAIELAARLDGEIVNADSMQVYRGMVIGTAKPTAEERTRARFHLLDTVTPDTLYNVSAWKQQAEAAITDIVARGKRPILCGGTGMYVRALLEDWALAETPVNARVRERLEHEASTLGSPALHTRLQQVDPATALRLHPNDAVRIVRALEVVEVSGIPISEAQAQDRANRTPRPAIRLGLTLPRPALYARIEARVDAMLAAGWIEEVRGLLAQGYSADLSPLKSLGYKEIIAHLQGGMDFETAVRDIKQNTRRFAKRQQTWFRADPLIVWCDVSAFDSATVAEQLISLIEAETPI